VHCTEHQILDGKKKSKHASLTQQNGFGPTFFAHDAAETQQNGFGPTFFAHDAAETD
jgi:hypothetical protein